MSISTHQLIQIRPAFLQRAREQGFDDLGQPVERVIANGGEPCRDVLRQAKPGEELILASYCPFELSGPYKEYGPVFILADPEAEHLASKSFAELIERAYFSHQFVLRAYSTSERIVDACLSSPAQFETDISRFFDNREIAFVLARFAAYGCYGCRIVRARTLANLGDIVTITN